MVNETRLKMVLRNFDTFLWTSTFQNPLVYTDFDIFLDKVMSQSKDSGHFYLFGFLV